MIIVRGLAYLLSAGLLASLLHRLATRVLSTNSSINQRRLRPHGGWAYVWPYAKGGSCRCERQPWGEYRTESECMESMAASPFEGCTYRHSGFVEEDCKYAVALKNFVRNSACRDLCIAGVTGELSDWAHFQEHCQLEKYSLTSGGQVRVRANGCFSNHIWGHSDRSVTEIPTADIAFIGYASVESPSQCQDFCQGWEECDNWFWRGSLEDVNRASAFSNAGKEHASSTDVKFWETHYTCFLKKNTTVLAAEEAVIPTGLLAAGIEIDEVDPLWRDCDITKKWESIAHEHKAAGEDSVCHCGCVWNSPKHVSGPKFCSVQTSLAMHLGS